MIENAPQANKAINRLKIIGAEIQILKSKFNEAVETFNNESTEIKKELKDYYYSLPKESLEETKTLRFYKIGDSKLQEKIQEPEYVRDESTLIKWAEETSRGMYIKTIPETKQFDWAGLKKMVKITGDKVVTTSGEEVRGVTIKKREPVFEIVIK